MALVSQCKCHNPKLFHNKYTGKDVYVSCGKCLSCKRARQSSWVAKLTKEAKCHKFAYVLYLDYNEDSLPKYDFAPDGESLVESTTRLSRYYDKVVPSQKFISFSDLKFDHEYDRQYFIDRLNTHHTCIPHASVYDLQLFKKRLNTFIKREITGKYSNFRSAIVSELGGTTYRPHYHGLLFFDDDRIASKINDFVVRAWRSSDDSPLGDAHSEPSKGHFASYLAKYICVDSDLPSFYEHPALRPIFLTSRKPAIGSLFESSAEIRWIFDNATPKRVEFEKQGELYVPKVFPLGQSFENRLFPKCNGYSQVVSLDGSARFLLNELYKCAVVGNDVPPYKIWLKYVFNRILYENGFALTSVLPFRYKDDPFRFYTWCLADHRMTLRNTDFAMALQKLSRDFETERFFISLYTISKRVFMQSRIFGVTLDDYLSKVYLYNDRNRPLFQLQRFYDLQSLIGLQYSNYDYRVFYPLSYYNFGVDPTHAPDAINYLGYQTWKYFHERKTKEKNDYFERLQYKDHPLYLLLKTFKDAKKCNEDVKAVT